MISIDKIFSEYNKLISPLSQTQQGFISLVLLLFLVWQIYQIIKSGHWIFIVLLVLFLPGTWPATKQIGEIVYRVCLFLFEKAKNVV